MKSLGLLYRQTNRGIVESSIFVSYGILLSQKPLEVADALLV